MPPELQDWVDLAQELPFYVRFMAIATVTFMILSVLVGVGLIIQLHRLVAAVAGARPLSKDTRTPTPGGPSTLAQGPYAQASYGPPPSSHSPSQAPVQYGPRPDQHWP